MSAARALEQVSESDTWRPLSAEELERALRAVSNGRSVDGEISACGNYLIARRPSTHPLHGDRWEIYGREARRWSIKSAHVSRERARREADRQGELSRASRALREPCAACGGRGWRAGDDCGTCVGSGSRPAMP